jgi:hypothetical protein
MPNNPVQIVLNDRDFIAIAEPGRLGPRKEFFPVDDGSFSRHKARLVDQIEQVEASLSDAAGLAATVVRVRLQEDAFAKSHRPDRALFTPDRSPCVGAGGLGELFYFLSATGARLLLEAARGAEETTTRKRSANGNEYFAPSNARSEVGAIEAIDVMPAEEKRRFSVDFALSWLSDAGTLGGYIVELFPLPPAQLGSVAPDANELFRSLTALIEALDSGTRARALKGDEYPSLLEVNVLKAEERADLVGGDATEAGSARQVVPMDMTPDRHEAILASLAQHPLVRKISLPFKLILSNDSNAGVSATPAALASKTPGVIYPRVGVIDNGISAALSDWVLDRHDFLATNQVDSDHGTFIAGLLTWGQSLNGPAHCPEADGCELIDIALFPRGRFTDIYRRGFDDFLEEVENAIAEATAQHGVRIFNLSINVTQPVDDGDYSYFAARLDQIADRHGVVLVNSVGNLSPAEFRSPWPKRPRDVIDYFARRTSPDTIAKPSESARMISVGAINPDGCAPHLSNTPTTYTRRGPGLRVGQKPDLAHFGGSEAVGNLRKHGLSSVGIDGSVIESCGTSYAAPLVAKTLATLDARTNGRLPTHSLRALAIHHASCPEVLEHTRLRDLVRQFIGFGVPRAADAMLETDDNGITLLFMSTLPARRRLLRFPFAWPNSLVDPASGSCRGSVRMTLVYDPPLDRRFGTEVVRVNLDANLRQRSPDTTKKGNPRFESRVPQCFLPKTSGQPAFERELINQGLKWWPTKRYEKIFPDEGVGELSDWVLEVESTTRAEATFPPTGVPFTVLLTIEDPEGGPIFQEVRRDLQARNVVLQDVQVAPRVRPRT